MTLGYDRALDYLIFERHVSIQAKMFGLNGASKAAHKTEIAASKRVLKELGSYPLTLLCLKNEGGHL